MLENLAQNYTAQAIRFLQAQSKRPFFLYLAHTMPHIPLAVSAKFMGKSRYGLYGDVVEELDAGIGRVLEAIEALGIDDETFVFVMSDNGPLAGGREDCGGSTGGLRGSKGTSLGRRPARALSGARAGAAAGRRDAGRHRHFNGPVPDDFGGGRIGAARGSRLRRRRHSRHARRPRGLASRASVLQRHQKDPCGALGLLEG